MSIQISKLKEIYERDYYLWLEKTAEILKSGKLERLDLEN